MKRFLIITALALAVTGCGSSRKAEALRKSSASAAIFLPREDLLPELDTTGLKRDTLKVEDPDGREVLIMKAVRDQDGEMVATDVIDAAVITARFRNVAERRGKVDLRFQVTVPESMQDGKWQIRLTPDMYMLGDSVALDPVIITGAAFRRSQLRGYEHYRKFLRSIVTDSAYFRDIHQLEVFISRNIPALYAYRNDSTTVADSVFSSAFGVTEREAIDHYTRKLSKRLNARRAARSSAMYRKYIPVPIVSEGIRLDTVIRADEEFVYLYRETLPARDGKKKAKLSVCGKIFELNKAIYTIPPTDTLTYYISSLTAFIDKSLNPYDAKYRDGLAALQNRDYKRAVTLLQSYQDINTALAYLEMDYNGTARIILENLPDSENVLYLKAVVYARTGREEQARESFLKACELKPGFWHRGNLDPEISYLVQRFNLSNTQSINF